MSLSILDRSNLRSEAKYQRDKTQGKVAKYSQTQMERWSPYKLLVCTKISTFVEDTGRIDSD
jgi:hypothetical protein